MIAVKKILFRILTGTVLIAGLVFVTYFLPKIAFSFTIMLILSWILIDEWPKLISTKNKFYRLLTPIYPILPFVLAIYLNQITEYRFLLFIMFLIVASHDTGSYFAGISFGKNKILPQISPKKTWEGLAGGYVTSLIIMYIYTLFFPFHSSLPKLFAFTILIGTISFLGDAFESYLKRNVGLKDTSSILPEHGGFLDRLDGSMFAIFIFFFFRAQLLNFFS